LDTHWSTIQAAEGAAAALVQQAEALTADADPAHALTLWKKCALHRHRVWAPTHPRLADTWDNMGRLCASLGRFGEAAGYVTQAIDAMRFAADSIERAREYAKLTRYAPPARAFMDMHVRECACCNVFCIHSNQLRLNYPHLHIDFNIASALHPVDCWCWPICSCVRSGSDL
jgi:hypothetical protein